jgi:hypothetical protein
VKKEVATQGVWGRFDDKVVKFSRPLAVPQADMTFRIKVSVGCRPS